MFLFVGAAWALWNTRNKMAIEHILPKSPLQVLYSGILFMQKWRQLLKVADQDEMEELESRIRGWAHAFNPSDAAVTDIMEL